MNAQTCKLFFHINEKYSLFENINSTIQGFSPLSFFASLAAWSASCFMALLRILASAKRETSNECMSIATFNLNRLSTSGQHTQKDKGQGPKKISATCDGKSLTVYKAITEPQRLGSLFSWFIHLSSFEYWSTLFISSRLNSEQVLLVGQANQQTFVTTTRRFRKVPICPLECDGLNNDYIWWIKDIARDRKQDPGGELLTVQVCESAVLAK